MNFESIGLFGMGAGYGLRVMDIFDRVVGEGRGDGRLWFYHPYTAACTSYSPDDFADSKKLIGSLNLILEAT